MDTTSDISAGEGSDDDDEDVDNDAKGRKKRPRSVKKGYSLIKKKNCNECVK